MDNTTYEFFIRRAWNTTRFKKGADADIWNALLMANANLIDTLGTPKEVKNLKEFEKRFKEVKGYLDKAYEKLLSNAATVLPPEVLTVLQGLKTAAAASENPQNLFNVLRRSMDIMNTHKL